MRLGLALAGGGAKGAFAAGVVEAVEAAGLVPTVLSGTSAGALNVAALAAGIPAAELGALWLRTRAADVYRPRADAVDLSAVAAALFGGGAGSGDAVGSTWLYDTAPLRATIVGVLGGERVAVRDGVRVVVSAVDLASGELVRFCDAAPPAPASGGRYRAVDLGADHLMASAAIPLLFPPVVVDGRAHCDGGLVEGVPLAPVLAYAPADADADAPPLDAVIVVTTAVGSAAQAARRHGTATGRDGTPRPEVLVVDPVGVDLGDALDFGAARAERRVAAGRALGGRAVAGWFADGRLTR